MQQFAPPTAQNSNSQVNCTLRSNTTGVEYQIIEQIGVGAEGIVYKGQIKNSNTIVAIKMHFSSTKKDGLDVLQKKQFSYLINIQDIIVQSDNTFIVMDYADGEFYKYMQTNEYKNKTKEEKNQLFLQVFPKLIQIVKGVEELHKLKLIHRDIKPENVLYFRQQDGILLKLCDFGLLKNSMDYRKTPNIGTPYYWAPEIISDQQQAFYSDQVDIWALGMLWYEMIVGKPMFNSFQTVPALQNHIKTMSQQWLDNEIEKCTYFDDKEKDLLKKKFLLVKTFPAQRASAFQLIQDLQNFQLNYAPTRQNNDVQIQVQQLQGQQSNGKNDQQRNQPGNQIYQQTNLHIPVFKPQQVFQQFPKNPCQQFNPNFVPQIQLQQFQKVADIDQPTGQQNFGWQQNNQGFQKQFNIQQNPQEDQQFQKALIQMLEKTIQNFQTEKQTEKDYLIQQIKKLEEQLHQCQLKIDKYLQEINEMENQKNKMISEQLQKQIEVEALFQQKNQKISDLEKKLSQTDLINKQLQIETRKSSNQNCSQQKQTFDCLIQINQKILNYQLNYLQDEMQSLEQTYLQTTYYNQSVINNYNNVQEKIKQHTQLQHNDQQLNQQQLISQILEKSKQSLEIICQFTDSFTQLKLHKKSLLSDGKRNVESQCENNDLGLKNKNHEKQDIKPKIPTERESQPIDQNRSFESRSNGFYQQNNILKQLMKQNSQKKFSKMKKQITSKIKPTQQTQDNNKHFSAAKDKEQNISQ